jgi:hypothetical protein
MSAWQRVPVIVRAPIAGLLVSGIGVTLWGGLAGFPGLAGFNLRVMPQAPWAIVPMALFLFVYLRYLNGAGHGAAHGFPPPRDVVARYRRHRGIRIPRLPFYFAISPIYGGLAYATNSILPGMALHAGGDRSSPRSSPSCCSARLRRGPSSASRVRPARKRPPSPSMPAYRRELGASATEFRCRRSSSAALRPDRTERSCRVAIAGGRRRSRRSGSIRSRASCRRG